MPGTTSSTDPAAPLISIVLTTHRPNPFFALTLESVRKQTWTHWEMIVVDDGWEDKALLREMVGDDHRCRIVTPPHGGIAKARNRGLAEAVGDFIVFLDHDDEWLPEHIATLTRALESEPDAVGSFSRGLFVDHKSEEIPNAPVFSGPFATEDIIGGGNRPSINTMLARRDVVRRLGGFEYLVEPSDDLDMIFKMALEGPFVCTGSVTALYRIHDGNVSGDFVAISDSALRMLHLHEQAALSRGDARQASLFRKNRLYQQDCYASLARRELTRALRARDRREARRLFRWYARLPVRSLAHDVYQGVATKATRVFTRPR